MNQNVIIGVGANIAGQWGAPADTIQVALRKLAAGRTRVEAVSPFYTTSPMGSGAQTSYVNGVISLSTTLPPLALLMMLKSLERASGRRGGRPWGPRTLDLDIVDYKGLVQNWNIVKKHPMACRRGGLILPHAHLHMRAFVLVPLMNLAPNWRHPILHRTAKELLTGLPARGQGDIQEQILFEPSHFMPS